MRQRNALPFLGGILALYVAIPVIAFGVRLISSPHRGFHNPGLFDSLYVSGATATVATIVIAIIGLPLAYLLARSRRRIASAIGVMVYLPLAIPPVMSGILLIYLVGPYTTVGRFFHGHLTETFTGIVLAQVFVAAPFLVVSARSAMHAIDVTLFEKAKTLGRGEFALFWRVAIPVAWGGIRAGLLLTWLRAFGEYGATVILGYHPYSLPVFTYLQFSGPGLPATEAPTALALLLAVVVVCLSRVRPRERRRKARLHATTPPTEIARRLPIPVNFAFDHHLGDFHLQCSYRAATANVAILGASGAGKSCVLRCIAGLYGPKVGTVTFGVTDVSGLLTEQRNVGYVPQTLALFPHLVVEQQLMFGAGADPMIARYWLDRLQLSGLELRFPHELSGGQRQRVSLAQALCRSPELLLLDEPFSALDVPVRTELRHEFRRLQRERGLSTVLVTHDPEEAAMLADDIIVIANGIVLQSGARADVFGAPSSAEVARLLGVANISSAVVHSDNRIVVGDIIVDAPTNGLAPTTRVMWCVRPEQIDIGLDGSHIATVHDAIDLGGVTEYRISLSQQLSVLARSSTVRNLHAGATTTVNIPMEAIAVWPQVNTPEN